MGIKYGDLLEYGGREVDSEIGRTQLPDVIEGDHRSVSYSVVRPEEIDDISDENVLSFNRDNCDAFTRLENYVLDTKNNIFYVDEHNNALAGWLAADNEGMLEGDTLLFHIDGHYDDEVPRPFYPPENVSEAEELIGDMLQINEFIYPAEQWGLVDDKINWGVEENVRELLMRDVGGDSLVIDLDLDVFRDIGDPEPVYGLLNDLISEADFTTVATSPGYIEQDEALHHLERIMES